MPTAEKAQTIEEAKEWYSRSTGMVFTDYRGLKVKEMQELRRAIRAKGGELHVLKNTLFRRAVGEDANLLPDELHNGPTAVAFIFENEGEVSKAIFTYAQTNKKLEIKGGFFGGKVVDAKGVEAISKLPPREVLLAQVIGAIAAPLSNLVGVIEALYADPIRVIGAVADKVAEGSPLPEPQAAEQATPEAEAPATESGASTATEEEKQISEPGATSSEPEAAAAPAENAPSVEAEAGEAALPEAGTTETGEGSEGSEETTSTEG